MAQPQTRETGFSPSSPPSSNGGADSYNHEGTPDTRLTAFSPEESSAKSTKLIKALTSSSSDRTTTYRGDSGAADKDPFVSSTPARKQEQKLSATASAFRPFSSSVTALGSTDVPSGPHQSENSEGACPVALISSSLSTELHLSRCLAISSPSQPISQADVERLLSNLEQFGSPCRGTKQIFIGGPTAYVRFSNIRDACSVNQNVHLGGPTWVADYVTPTEFGQITQTGAPLAADCEGQLFIFALNSPGSSRNGSQVESIVLGVICSEGDVFAMQKLASLETGMFKVVVEYADAGVALGTISKLNGATIEGVNLVVSFYKGASHAFQPDSQVGMATPLATPLSTPIRNTSFHDFGHDGLPGMALAKTPQSAAPMVAQGQQTPPQMGLPVSPRMPVFHPVIFRPFAAPAPYLMDRIPPPLSPTASSVASFGGLTPLYSSPAASTAVTHVHQDFSSPRQLHGYSRPDNRRQNATRVHRSSYYNAAGHHNHVDVNRIREGIDVRTTIMLRNIPNKVDQAMLKRIVDESSWGKYDFMYLRIDFANDCNVGYAFINFVDPLDIIDFVNARGNQRWNCFKSDKVAEISYATIQGKDCLVQKFRNSSVMLEAPHYRPKLYFTSNGPMPNMAGQEETFPVPDNQSKMKRSCENAEHVGLFTPNAGQHFRDEQRRRRSQYDRGTRLAALEEYDYESAFQQLYV